MDSSITKLLGQNGFLKTVFEAIPCGVLIIDAERRVHAVNNVLKQTFGVSETDVLYKRGGEALKCVHAFRSPKGCGSGSHCETCQVKKTALDAINGKGIHRHRASVELQENGESRNLQLLVSAAPIVYEENKYAIVILEDVSELNTLRKRMKTQHSFAGIVGSDSKMLDLFESIEDLTDVIAPVLIQGESGTGKELVASAIHSEGLRADKLFVPVNCSALPETLLESELFGHVRGAFTGAIRDKKGRFELADGGTIFLDEIGDLSPAIQIKLLRVIQEGSFERLGAEDTIKVDVRVVSATHKDLRREIAAGRFREDLFYRICVIPLSLPPLRERRNDIPFLIDHITTQIATETGRKPLELSHEALNVMLDHDWPGNVRELQNALQFASVKCKDGLLRIEHLPSTVSSHKLPVINPTRKRRSRKLNDKAVRAALDETGGNKVEAARKLGVSRATLYRFLDELEA
ncbi:sigma-54 interaction domain-containing protein [Candidatus Hydrogenedentota bacterium]